MARILIIGYGSSLRSDDNVGRRVAQLLDEHYSDDPDVRVIGSHQLTPEMSEDVAGSKFVLFLDAAAGQSAGKIVITTVAPETDPASFTHHLSPALLLSAATELYGSAPPAKLLTIAGAAFEPGDQLSPMIVRKLPEFLEAALTIVESSRHLSAA